MLRKRRKIRKRPKKYQAQNWRRAKRRSDKPEQDAEKAYRRTSPQGAARKDAQLGALIEELAKRPIKTNLQYSRQIEDLKHTLGNSKGFDGRCAKAFNATIAALEQQTNEIIKIEEERYAKRVGTAKGCNRNEVKNRLRRAARKKNNY